VLSRESTPPAARRNLRSCSSTAGSRRRQRNQGYEPARGWVLGFLAGFRSVVAIRRLLQDLRHGIVGDGGAVAVDFRVHPDLDELWLLPIIHICTPGFPEEFLHDAVSRRQRYKLPRSRRR
jgi:hypothetical protein